MDAFQKANQHVYQRYHGPGGATAVAALMVDGKMLIGNAGDSRAYQIRDGHLRQISEDHTLSEKLVRDGIVTREQLRTGAVHVKNVVYHAIGLPEENFKADLFQELLKEGDMVLLCTDGVWGFVEDAEIEQTIHEQPLGNVVGHLIDLANARGGRDNITAILIWPEE